MRIFDIRLQIISISLTILFSGLINFTYGQVNETSKIYENRDIGIKFLYPSYWPEIVESPDCNQQSICVVTFGDAFLFDRSPKGSYNSLMDSVRDSYGFEAAKSDFSFINDNQTMVGKNHSGWQYEYTTFKDGVKSKGHSVFAEKDGNYYSFHVVYPDESGAKRLTEFKKLIDSIELLPVQVPKTPSFMNTNETQSPIIFEETLPSITVGDKEASLHTKVSPPDKKQNTLLQLKLIDTKTGNNITNVNYFLTISKDNKLQLRELFYSKDGPLTLEFEPNQGPVTVNGTTEPFLGGWMNETGPVTVSGPVLTQGGQYHYNVEIFGVDNVRNIFVPENAPKFDSSFSIDMNGTEQIKPSSTFQTNPSSMLESTPDGLQILSHNSFTDSLGYLHVVGEVQNNSPTSVQFVQVTGTFYDNNNQVVGTDFTYTNPSDIGAGQKAPFELILTSASIPVSEIERYNLIASSQ